MKALDKLWQTSKKLDELGIESPAKEAEQFIRRGLGISLTDLYANNPDLNEQQTGIVDDIVLRRSRREPLQYILGYTEFLGLQIMVGRGVLIPRPETELMAEHAIKVLSSKRSEMQKQGLKKTQCMTILDLCTGSGCLALSLAGEFTDAQVYGIDISDIALSYARENSETNSIGNVDFIKGHLFKALNKNISFDFIISNPPYIRTNEIPSLQAEIKDWEPMNALDGGDDGMDFYRQIIPEARNHLNDNGILMFELGIGCADTVSELFDTSGYRQIEIMKDYAGIDRIISAHK